jgi:hypothetical protein
MLMDVQQEVTANLIICCVHELHDQLFIYPCQHALNTLPLSILPSDVPRHQPCNLTAGLHEEQSCVAHCRSRALWAINVQTPLRLRLYPRCICWAMGWSNKGSGAETESVLRGVIGWVSGLFGKGSVVLMESRTTWTTLRHELPV